MKFKTKEELIRMSCDCGGCNCSENGVNNAFKSFKTRIAFYTKYKGNYRQFKEDSKKGTTFDDAIFSLFVFTTSLEKAGINWHDNDFDNWLLYYCFGDIIK